MFVLTGGGGVAKQRFEPYKARDVFFSFLSGRASEIRFPKTIILIKETVVDSQRKANLGGFFIACEYSRLSFAFRTQ